MSETPPADGAGAQEAPSLRVLAQYLKDHSFENPRAPDSFLNVDSPPAIEVSVDVSGRGMSPEQYEVELTISAQAKHGEDIAFVVETTYAGVFEIKNIPKENMEPIMLIECPRLLFPFVRQIIAETTTSGNFPPVMLDPIDFLSIYQSRKAEQAAQGQPAAEA